MAQMAEKPAETFRHAGCLVTKRDGEALDCQALSEILVAEPGDEFGDVTPEGPWQQICTAPRIEHAELAFRHVPTHP